MSRSALKMKLVNLEEGLPTVEQARTLLFRELQQARRNGIEALKLVHGYGSKGVGGAIRVAIQGSLAARVREGQLRAFIAGEDFRISDETTWALLRKYPELKQDRDLGRGNKGISIVLL
ncbi:MAG TPA: Smr/MutS family protein [Clostridia bacterium]|nr:Smr/MutS family protein [Clostridia bacterium]